MDSVWTYMQDLRDDAKEKFDSKTTYEDRNEIPADLDRIPLEKPHWLRIESVVAVYGDMVGSTKLSVEPGLRATTMASVYELFTASWVRILNEFGAKYIDIQGDGAFGLFDGEGARYPALCAAVTFKTFSKKWIEAWVEKKAGDDAQIAASFGMDEYPVMVKRVGMRGEERQNEVWAGKPINVAVKLAALAEGNQLLASERLYDAFISDFIYMSCGCKTEDTDTTYAGEKVELWSPLPLESEELGFDTAYVLKATWCPTHGDEYCEAILALAD